MSKAGDQTQTEIVLGVPEGEPGTTEANIALTTLADRYERRRVIGRGGIGVVYEAYDRKDRTLVALKTIERVSAESLYRFKLEFRALADVQHRNLVRLGELSCEGAEWFFTMELVPGPDVVEHVRGTDREGAPPVEGHVARLRAVLSQLVAAIATVHEAGRVHRDIKPSNVLVTDAGRVVVLDFGLVASRAGLARADEGIVGTPAFMAPEQVTGSAVGPESDWYALGAVLYAALTGHPPFEGPWQQILEAKLDRAPPHPRDVDPAVPADLDELCMELLAREPTGRPRLVSIAARVGLAPGEVDALAFASTDDATLPFVGRAAELAALREAFEQVVGGQGRVVVVAGEPGIGKSALLRSFLTEVGSSALVLSGRCYEQETVPFKGVDAIIDALAENLLARGEVEVAGILGTTGARYLAAIFPTLNRVPLVAADSAVARPLVAAAALREQAFVELERLLGAIAAAQPLVLHLEDLQWADKDSFALLARALEGATGASCLFVGTLRGDAPLPPEAASLLARAERIALHALSDEESRELLATLRWSRQGDEEDPEPLVREGRGHPLFLAELARARRSGPAVPGGHGTLEEVLWRRVQDRDEVDRRFLEMTAIAGAPTPYAVIARAAGTDVGEAQTRLGSLRAAQLIRVSRRGGERYVEPYHERIRESVLERVRRRDEPGGIARRRLELGRALLAATSPEALRERVLSIVQNMNAAIDLITDRGERRRLAELELVAAREALRATAFEQARGYAKVGLELAGDSGWDDEYALTRDLYGVRMAAEAFGGDAAASRASFEEARAHAATTVDRTATVVDWMELQTSQGALLEAVRTGREELAALGVKLPQRATRRMVLAFLLQVRVLRGKRSIEELLYLPKLEGDPVHEGAMRVLVALAPAAYMLDANLRSLIHLLNVKLTLLYGASDVSAYGFSGYGSILSAVFGKVVQGESLG
ncbi:MAG TPA: AAA family ATPase, partial [Polyangiaceae bacterium]